MAFEDLKYRISGDSSEFRRAAKQASVSADQFARKAKKSFDDISASAKTISKPIAAAFAAGTAAAAAYGAAINKLTKDFAAFSEDVSRASDSIGISTDSFQEALHAFQSFGMSSDNVVKAMTRLGDRASKAAQGNKRYADALERIGLSVRDLQGLSPDEMFRRVAAAMGDTADATDRAAAAGAIFGENTGRKLLPMLAQGAEGFDALAKEAHELGAVMSGDALQAGSDYQSAIDKLNTTISAISKQIGAAFTPAVTEGAEALGDFFKNIATSDDAMQGIVSTLADIGLVIAGAATALERLGEVAIWTIGAFSFNLDKARQLTDRMRSATDQFGNTVTTMAARIKTAGDNTGEYTLRIIELQQEMREANTTAERQLEIQRELGELYKEQDKISLRAQAGGAGALADAREALIEASERMVEERDQLVRSAGRLGFSETALSVLNADLSQLSEHERARLETLRSAYMDVSSRLEDTRNRTQMVTRELDKSMDAMQKLSEMGDGVKKSVDNAAAGAAEPVQKATDDSIKAMSGAQDMARRMARDHRARLFKMAEDEKRAQEKMAADLAREQERAAQRALAEQERQAAENARLAEQWQHEWEQAADRMATVVSGALTESFIGVLEGNIDRVHQGIKALIRDLVVAATRALALRALTGGTGSGAGAGVLGQVFGFADGGRVFGPGTSRSDSIPARLSAGEYVINASAARLVGYDWLDKVNSAARGGRTGGGKYAGGGAVDAGLGGSVRIINVTDPSEIAAVMSGATGEKVIYNVISRLKREVNAVLNG